MNPFHTYEVYRTLEAALLVHMGCPLLAIVFTERGQPRYVFSYKHRMDHELLKARADELLQRTKAEYNARRVLHAGGRSTVGDAVQHQQESAS